MLLASGPSIIDIETRVNIHRKRSLEYKIGVYGEPKNRQIAYTTHSGLRPFYPKLFLAFRWQKT